MPTYASILAGSLLSNLKEQKRNSYLSRGKDDNQKSESRVAKIQIDAVKLGKRLGMSM